MIDAVAMILICLGVLLVVSGTLIVLFRERWTRNVGMSSTARIRRSGGVPTAVDVGLPQILCGAGALVLGFVRMGTFPTLGPTVVAVREALGDAWWGVAASAMVFGALGAAGGILVISRMLRQRAVWGRRDGDDALLGKARKHIVVASFVFFVSGIALVYGVAVFAV